jgi:hypothetical protein
LSLTDGKPARRVASAALPDPTLQRTCAPERTGGDQVLEGLVRASTGWAANPSAKVLRSRLIAILAMLEE